MSSHSNQIGQFFSGQYYNNIGHYHQQPQQKQQQQQQYQEYHHFQQHLFQQQHLFKRQHQQEINVIPQIQQPHSNMTENSSNNQITPTQHRNASRTSRIVIMPTEVIDLTSPPSSPAPLQISPDYVQNIIGCELIRIPERLWGQDIQDDAAYKVLND